MQYTEIKDTGIKIPSIIFGTSALGNLYKTLDKNTKLDIVRECLNSVDGPVVFDSAGKYGAGLALEELGRILKVLDVNPGKVVISNKLGWLRTELTSAEPTFERGVWVDINFDARQEIGRDGIMRCLEQGNKLLGSVYRPGLLSVHDPDEYLAQAGDDEDLRKKLFEDIIEAYRTLFEIKKMEGSTAIGIGAKDWKIIRQISEKINLDWIMIANSLTLYSHPADLVKFMTDQSKKGITIINSAVFNGGFLIGGDYFNYRLLNKDKPGDMQLYKWREEFFTICDMYQVKPSHACIRFGMSHPAISSVALNTSNPGHVKRNVEEVENEITPAFFNTMKEKNLIDRDYPFI
ncbi:MAG: aldo/keto reductase [Bacteroidia bacterium]|nr:aldo/keto reductase [Bacteroidia bacterium]